MNRQPMDLLDLFRNPGAAASGKGARAVSRPVKEPGSSRRAKGTGMVGRERVLFRSALALLLVLSFVAGVGVGKTRRGSPSPALAAPAKAAAKPATTWLLRSRALPRVSMGAGKLDEVAVAALRSRYPILAPFVTVAVAEGAKGVIADKFVLILEGFPDKPTADEWRRVLSVWEVDGQIPFAGSQPYPRK